MRDPARRRAAETAALANRRRRPVLRLVAASPQPGDVEVGDGFDVDPVDLSQRCPLALPDSEPQP